jgi:hypothetical protein
LQSGRACPLQVLDAERGAVDLLARVSVETVEIVEAMRAAPRQRR